MGVGSDGSCKDRLTDGWLEGDMKMDGPWINGRMQCIDDADGDGDNDDDDDDDDHHFFFGAICCQRTCTTKGNYADTVFSLLSAWPGAVLSVYCFEHGLGPL